MNWNNWSHWGPENWPFRRKEIQGVSVGWISGVSFSHDNGCFFVGHSNLQQFKLSFLLLIPCLFPLPNTEYFVRSIRKKCRPESSSFCKYWYNNQSLLLFSIWLLPRLNNENIVYSVKQALEETQKYYLILSTMMKDISDFLGDIASKIVSFQLRKSNDFRLLHGKWFKQIQQYNQV